MIRRLTRTFSYSPRKQGFRKQVRLFGSKLNKHKYKILLITGAAAFPYYKPFLLQQAQVAEAFVHRQIAKVLDKDQPIPTITESFLKQTFQEVFKDKEVRSEGVVFVEDLLAQRKLIDAVVKMLMQAIEDPVFLEQLKKHGIDVGLDIVNDEDVSRDVTKLVARLLKDDELRFEVTNVLKKMMQDQEVLDQLAVTLVEVSKEEEFRLAFTNLLNDVLNNVLLDPVTTEKVRIFMYTLMSTEVESGKLGGSAGRNMSLFDLMVNKMVTRRPVGANQKSEIEDLLGISRGGRREEEVVPGEGDDEGAGVESDGQKKEAENEEKAEKKEVDKKKKGPELRMINEEYSTPNTQISQSKTASRDVFGGSLESRLGKIQSLDALLDDFGEGNQESVALEDFYVVTGSDLDDKNNLKPSEDLKKSEQEEKKEEDLAQKPTIDTEE